MTRKKSKKKDAELFEIIIAKSRSSQPYHSTRPLMEQIIENILLENEKNPASPQKTMEMLLKEFVDWNEVRVVTMERLLPFFKNIESGEAKAKSLQAFLNKIFSRSGSLECQFLLELDVDALEDYLAGIMEFKEGTRKTIIIRVFKKSIFPFTMDHEIVFERVGTMFSIGDEQMRAHFAQFSPEGLEGAYQFLNSVQQKHCHEEKPACGNCPLKPACIYAASRASRS